MKFSEEDIAEFRAESADLLDQAESALLKLDQGGEFKSHYEAVFRVFHSLKGGSGMLDLKEMQSHMHKLENKLAETKNKNTISKLY